MMSMMRAFIVHRPDSGEVVHVHLQPCDLEVELDEILTMIEPSRASKLSVLEVPVDQLPSAGFAVREGRLVQLEDAGTGAGGTNARERGERTYELRGGSTT
jgi:hypothetical protein